MPHHLAQRVAHLPHHLPPAGISAGLVCPLPITLPGRAARAAFVVGSPPLQSRRQGHAGLARSAGVGVGLSPLRQARGQTGEAELEGRDRVGAHVSPHLARSRRDRRGRVDETGPRVHDRLPLGDRDEASRRRGGACHGDRGVGQGGARRLQPLHRPLHRRVARAADGRSCSLQPLADGVSPRRGRGVDRIARVAEGVRHGSRHVVLPAAGHVSQLGVAEARRSGAEPVVAGGLQRDKGGAFKACGVRRVREKVWRIKGCSMLLCPIEFIDRARHALEVQHAQVDVEARGVAGALALPGAGLTACFLEGWRVVPAVGVARGEGA
eukprot:scaffold116755_cov48-Phaeocystis_antarctica.AAC.2